MTDQQWLAAEIAKAQTHARLAWIAEVVNMAVRDGDRWATDEAVEELRSQWRQRKTEIAQRPAK